LYCAQWPGDNIVRLSRWCWARLQGRNNNILHIIVAYQPCKADSPLTTYQQHTWHWSWQGINTCPKEQFLLDLEKSIAQWQKEGDQIVLMVDMNKDIRAMQLQEFCHKLNLVKGIMHLHGLAKTPTHQQGSKAIDRIFLSEGLLEEAQGGFLKFG